MKKNIAKEHSSATTEEVSLKERLKSIQIKILNESGPNWDTHQLATLTRQSLSRILYLDNLYSKIINVPGIIVECGVHYGASLSVLSNLRGIYEPYNFSRQIIGFDTFEGFIGVDQLHDGEHAEDGDYSTADGYEKTLFEILDIHRLNSPLSHVQKFDLIKGDASVTVREFFSKNRHKIVSMAIFDMDIYRPTKDALLAVLPQLVKGSLLVFDEFNCDAFPGETEAVLEVLDLHKYRLERHPHAPYCAFVQI